VTASEHLSTDPAPATAPTPLDRVLDLAVYVPVGLALAARDVLPRLAEVGRRQLAAQFTAARVVGRLAVDQGTRHAGKAVRRLVEEGGAALGGADRTPNADPGRDGPFPAPAPPPTAHDDPSPVAGGSADREARLAAVPDAPDGSTGAGAASDLATDLATDLDPAELAIPGYDTLSASQVVQRLPGLSPDELETVRSYEVARRGRKTIVLKIAQLETTT